MTTENNSKNEKFSLDEELAQLNKIFANRYTDEDEEYIKMAKPHSNSPPIVDDWTQEKNNYRDQRRHYSNDRYHNRYYRNDYRQNRNYSHDNRYRRDRSRSPQYHEKRQ